MGSFFLHSIHRTITYRIVKAHFSWGCVIRSQHRRRRRNHLKNKLPSGPKTQTCTASRNGPWLYNRG